MYHVVHTMSELKLTGNCLKGSRPVLSFDQVMCTTCRETFEAQNLLCLPIPKDVYEKKTFPIFCYCRYIHTLALICV